MLFEDMDSKYKEALRQLRAPENSVFKGFSIPWTYKSFEVAREQNLPETAEGEPLEEAPQEKTQVIESFKEFTQEQFEEKPVISFKGGEVSPSAKSEHLGISSQDLAGLEKRAESFYTPFPHLKERYQAKQTPLEVLFVSDTFIEEASGAPEAHIRELEAFFDTEVAALFGRMIKAMGLNYEQYLVTALHLQKSEETSFKDFLISEILYFKPKYIVCLGAKAVQELLGTQNRLKNIHGQFFELKFSDQNDIVSQATLMPLFSPKLLHIAPNMKQTAWKDMQKLMEKLSL